MIFIYCKTQDSPMVVGEAICRANSVDGKRKSWVVNGDGESCSIETEGEACGVVYLIGDSVVGVEADDDCACKIIEPLIIIYGFEKVKWLATK
ncbi:MAG: hypothetical protein ACXACB_00140 [Promethearchaeota archaeon]|jgi:hypothetical protein